MNRYFNPRHGWIMLAICSLFIILRIPSLIEPHWYGDEGIYQVVGRAMLDGRILYQQIWDNKPPLLYIIYASVNGDLFAVKALSLVSGLISVIVFFLLSKKLFKRPTTYIFSTFIFAILFGSPLLEGNIANAENFMLLPIILAGYFVYLFSESKKKAYLLLSGLLISLAILTKIVAIFDFAAFSLFILLSQNTNLKKINYRPVLLLMASIAPGIIVCLLYFISVGAVSDFYHAVFLQNVNYVGVENKFIFPMGTLMVKTLILLIFIFVIIYNHSKLSKKTLFIFLWVLFGIYSAFFSDRPYTHYLLMLLPQFALLVGHFIEVRKLRMYSVLAILAIIFIANFHFELYKKTIKYYLNFVTLITNNQEITKYEAFFDGNTPRDYSIASFINTNVAEDESIFLWSNSPQIYALSNKLPIGKYVVAYHISFYKNADIITKKQIEEYKPKFIIQTAVEPLVKEMLSSYKLRYIMEGAMIYEREI